MPATKGDIVRLQNAWIGKLDEITKDGFSQCQSRGSTVEKNDDNANDCKSCQNDKDRLMSFALLKNHELNDGIPRSTEHCKSVVLGNVLNAVSDSPDV